MGKFDDHISKEVYSFLEEEMKVEKLAYCHVRPKLGGKFEIILRFSTVLISDSKLLDLNTRLNTYLDNFTKGELHFVMGNIRKKAVGMASTLVSPLEKKTMWTSKGNTLIPLDGFYNEYTFTIKAVKS